ncbi:MAG TPA: SH3 domain-containing protein [Myxococcota bacterium]|nr:SH3 domain-containing protein [Myxococcota bacterium]
MRRRRGARASGLAAVAAIAVGAGTAGAEADGPDFFRVRGVREGRSLTVRAEPGVESARVGSLPAGADGIRNLGCEGGLPLDAWERASEAEREAARWRRWCRIEYRGLTGWAAGPFLAEGGPPEGSSEAGQ